MNDKIEMLTQPLLTEDGFINEACMNELESAILNTPETHERLKDEPEWNTPRCTTNNEIVGALAMWAVYQHAAAPPKLELTCNYVFSCLNSGPFKDATKYDNDQFRMVELSLCDINRLLWEYLGEFKPFLDWNEKDIVGEHWMDLSAILRNVCLTIRQQRRADDQFDKKFEQDEASMNEEAV